MIRAMDVSAVSVGPARPQVVRSASYSALVPLPSRLRDFGIDPRSFLAARGFDVRDFRDWPGRVDAGRVDALLGDCVNVTHCSHFGLLVGAGVGLAGAGVVGRLARHAGTVGQALDDLSMLPRLRDTFGAMHVAIAGDEARFGFAIHAAGLCHAEQAYDLMLAAMRNVMRELCGADWQPTLVHVPRRRPGDVQPYHEHLGRHLVFDATEAALAFPAPTLRQLVPGADPLLRELALRDATADVVKREPVLVAEVRRAIRLGLIDRDPSRRAASGRLGMHERTLGRHLHDAGTTFQALLEETRINVAQELLQCTDATVARIAVALGYRDSTVFARAFRRRLATTPREYREHAARRAAAALGNARRPSSWRE